MNSVRVLDCQNMPIMQSTVDQYATTLRNGQIRYNHGRRKILGTLADQGTLTLSTRYQGALPDQGTLTLSRSS